MSVDPERCSAELVLVDREARRLMIVPCELAPHPSGRHRWWTATTAVEWDGPAETGDGAHRKRVVVEHNH